MKPLHLLVDRFSQVAAKVHFNPVGLLEASGEQAADQRLPPGPARSCAERLKSRGTVVSSWGTLAPVICEINELQNGLANRSSSGLA